jgi:hypothetical protein
MSFHFMRTHLEIALASLPWPDADAMLLPTNDYLWMAEGPALEVKKQTGEEVEIEAVRQGPAALGEVVATGCGNLPLSAILHGAVMGQDLLVDAEAAGRAIQHGIKMACEKGWERLLVHSFLSTGKGTRRDSVGRMLAVLVEELLEGKPLRSVTLLAVDEAERAFLHEAVLHIIQSEG